MHSFLLIGQSNMAGRGYMADAREVDTGRIYTLRNGRWIKMFRPIHADRKTAGVSLAESFAECYAKKHNVDVGLICCADGGTQLNQWQPGEILFDNAICQAKLAQRTSKIVGVLWHQGESDCDAERYPAYRPRFEKMMQALREALDLQQVPFILGGLGDFLALCPVSPSLKNYIFVNDALKSIAENNPFTGFASAKGLTANPDNLHFNAASLYEFGLRYFEAFEKLYTPDAPAYPNKTGDLTRSAMELL